MKRLAIILIIVAAALTLSAPGRAAAQGESCELFEQPFSIPDAFPVDSDDWVELVQSNTVYGTLVERHTDGFTQTGTTGLNNGSGLRLVLPVSATITHVEAVLDGSNTFNGYVGLCEDVDCSGTVTYYGGIVSQPYVIDEDIEIENVVAIELFASAAGVSSSSSIEDLIIEGILQACPYRPVHEDEQVDEASSGDLYVITTDAGARVYAIDDAVVQTVTHNADGYFVRLLINGATPVIYSKLSATFAEIGDTIEGGCVLGYVSQAGPEAQVNTGQFAYQHDSNLGDWHDYIESFSTTPCGQDESNCINANPEMNTDQPGWLTRFNSGGSFNQGDDSLKSIVGAGMLYQPLTADFDATYFVTVVVALQPPATDGEIRVWFGGTESRMPIHTFGPEFVTITTLGFSTAFAGETELRLYNANSNSPTIRVTFACLHLGDAIIAPPPCYFEDAAINTDSFETEGGATFETGFLGQGSQYSLPPGGVIRSPVHLEATTDADSDFTLAIVTSGPDGPTELTASIVDSDTDDELQAIGTYNVSGLLWSNPMKRVFTLSASTALDGDLYIENTGDEDALIGSICLSSDSGYWPGYDNADAADHTLLELDCTECNFPESLIDVVAWVNWLGCVFNYLIRCLLYGLVNDIWNTALAIVSGIGLFGRWLGRAISIIATWAWLAAGRFLATLISSAIPIINAIMAWILGLPFVQDLLDSASIVGIWIEGVIQFVTAVINLFAAAVRFIGVLVTLVGQAWGAFITGLSASSEIAIVLPDCTDSGSFLYDACLLLDVLNFVTTEVPAFGWLLAAVAVSILWVKVREVRNKVEEIFEA